MGNLSSTTRLDLAILDRAHCSGHCQMASALKPMEQFSKDCVQFGTLRGFKYFSLYLRGKEELLVTIHRSCHNGIIPAKATAKGSTPTGPPPASPAINESEKVRNSTSDVVYLIGAYAKYKQPYVWLRSQQPAEGRKTKDVPLSLQSTTKWKKEPDSYRVWNIVAELVNASIQPTPANPFAVAFEALNAYPVDEIAVQSGALASFIYNQQLTGISELPFESFDELQRLLDCHFSAMSCLLPKQSV